MADTPLLAIENLEAYYGSFQALFGISLSVEAGETIAVIGANSAGKSTLMKAIVGLVQTRNSAIRFRGENIAGLETQHIVARGIALVPEGRRLFRSLSVEENLLAGGQQKRNGPWSLAEIYNLFPVLGERRAQPATSLVRWTAANGCNRPGAHGQSGSFAHRRVEPGIGPDRDQGYLRSFAAGNQTRHDGDRCRTRHSQALSVATRVYCLRGGRITLEGAPAALSRESISNAYFGV